jgi:hypothetical protein
VSGELARETAYPLKKTLGPIESLTDAQIDRILAGEEEPPVVSYRLSALYRRGGERSCHGCGGTGHDRRNCPGK